MPEYTALHVNSTSPTVEASSAAALSHGPGVIASICLDVPCHVNKNTAMPRQYTLSKERQRAWKQRRREILKRYRAIAKGYRKDEPGAYADLARELGLSRQRTWSLVQEALTMTPTKRAR